MSAGEIASMVFGALGVGGGVVSLYIRGTIAETIIVKLNGRYIGGKVCEERHVNLEERHGNLTTQLARMERQVEKIDQKVEDGFTALRLQLMGVQEAGRRIEHDQIRREQGCTGDRLNSL